MIYKTLFFLLGGLVFCLRKFMSDCFTNITHLEAHLPKTVNQCRCILKVHLAFDSFPRELLSDSYSMQCEQTAECSLRFSVQSREKISSLARATVFRANPRRANPRRGRLLLYTLFGCLKLFFNSPRRTWGQKSGSKKKLLH